MVPTEACLVIRRKSGYFPGMVLNVLNVDGRLILDPMDDFVDAHLRSRVEAQRRGGKLKGCVLFNDAINDGHFSAAGSEVWAESVGRRLLLLLDDARLLTHGTTRRPDDGRPAGGGRRGIDGGSVREDPQRSRGDDAVVSETVEKLPLWMKTTTVPRRSRWERLVARVARPRPARSGSSGSWSGPGGSTGPSRSRSRSLTILSVAVLLAAAPSGRYLAGWLRRPGPSAAM